MPLPRLAGVGLFFVSVRFGTVARVETLEWKSTQHERMKRELN